MVSKLVEWRCLMPWYLVFATSLKRTSMMTVCCAVSFSRCGDESVGNQSVWWRAVEPDEQCFGMSMPGRLCSRSTTDQFYCLAGPDWDTFRVEHGCPWRQRTNVVKLEVGNWLTVALAAATARIVLEEMMNYKVCTCWE